jgi:hypothetical protein
MARGFESKAVADQQAEAEAEDRRLSRRADDVDPTIAARRRILELARADAGHKLEQAKDERYRTMMQRAVADLDKQIGALP